MKRSKTIKFKVVEAGQRGPYKDSFYHYIVEAIGIREFDVRRFCLDFLARGEGVYKKSEMPNPFANELLELKIESVDGEEGVVRAVFRYKSLYTG